MLVTVSITVVLAVRVPEVAVIMIGELVTAAAVLAADTVITEAPVDVGFGLNVTVTPAGTFDAVSVTAPVAPLIVRVSLALAPPATILKVADVPEISSAVVPATKPFSHVNAGRSVPSWFKSPVPVCHVSPTMYPHVVTPWTAV